MAGLTSTFAARWRRAALGEPGVFAEVAADSAALQAAIVVIAGGLARGVERFAEAGWFGVAGNAAVGIVFWFVASVLVWRIGALARPPGADFPALLRAVGFSAAPLAALAICAALSGRSALFASLAIHSWAAVVFASAVKPALGAPLLRSLVVAGSALLATIALLVLAAGVLIRMALLD